MRKPLGIGLAVVVAVLLVTAGVLFTNYQKTSKELTASKAAEAQVQDRYAQTMTAIAEIQDSLNAIALGDTGVGVQPWKIVSGQEQGPRGQEALDRIAVLRSSIERSRARIQDLEDDLEKSGNRIAGLERVVGGLKRTLAEKEEMVALLGARVEALQTQVAGLETIVEETRDTLESKRRELATVYYAVGKKSDLEKAGIVKEKGGILGIGQTLVPVAGAPETAFTPLDTDAETMIWTGASKARVLSAQPEGSYELRPVAGRLELHIINPTEFRKVRRLIILTS